ncbi:hypothetical protein [Methanosarcina sp.]|uniref:prenylated flavin chaperone LpdD n=1 Tax=Methanosarcina sp. TaxID=2213 RepID=UPI002988375A|nr:hypothetical protein [Methanosarcina sp.]MDW5552171.1 hypothetical protein [Methanosarcina sp.]MDW5555945.1 hypothetical protein [Methanosarcina sp.]MDW5559533.1 hypothetical protein [Methanosarcina sp.]
MFQIKRKVGKVEVVLDAKKVGRDYMLTLTGGEEHVGAVAVGLFDEKSQRASSSVITMPGHREEYLALDGARQVSRATRKTSIFVVGIHKDNISPEEIKDIVSVAGEMIESFIAFYKKEDELGRQNNDLNNA